MGKITNKHKKPILAVILLSLVVGVAHVAERLNFFYFNPDSTQSNLRQLKSDMDAALQAGKIEADFQPFARLIDLDQQTRSNRPALLYIPYWYLERYGRELGLRPLLHSLRDDKSIYHKKLITHRSARRQIGQTNSTTLAMTTMGPDSKALLDELILAKQQLKAEKFSIIEVPKDLDAIFAVALGQVDSALVSGNSLRFIEKRNPRLTASVKVLADSQPINLPVLCYLEGSMTESQLTTLKKQLLDTSRKATNKIPAILGIDAWSTDL